jgi:hypothetical protein
MRSSRTSAVAIAILLLACAAVVQPAELVESVLAVVDGRVLCLSDVRAVERLDGVARDVALARLVDETLLFHEASRLPQSAVSGDDPASPDAARAGEDPAVRRALYRRAVIRKYVAFRFRPQVRVDEEAVRKLYAEEVVRGNAPAFEDAAPAIRERLAAQEVERRVADWVRDLRLAAVIRYNPVEPD